MMKTMTTAQRISVLERAVAKARREVSVLSLQILAGEIRPDIPALAEMNARHAALVKIAHDAQAQIGLLAEERA
jgi:hypothetical protein